MEWFSGNIPEAIQLAKSRGSIFIVYITGEEEATKEMDKMWAEEEVSQVVRQEAAVAIKIKGGSESCTFFSQIYPVVVIPSVYFIGNNGVPLEVLGGSMTSENFRQRVRAVLEKNKSSEASATPLEQPVQQQQQPPSQAAPAASAAQEVTTSSTAAAAAVSEEVEPDSKKEKVDISERVEKAKQLIEQKRAQKAKEEEEKERQKEVERRKMGQSLQQLKQYQQEREAQEVKEQLRKEKEEQRRARERVKEQIERDRAERNARYQKEKAEKEEQQEAARKAKLLEQQKAAAEAEARRSETARIQFRLPDGSSVSNQFPSTSPLQAAADFISPQVGSSVTLSTTFPRRTFIQADMASSFRDLQLAPTAVIIVVPAGRSVGGSSGGGGGGVGGILSLLLAPLMMIWNFLLSFFTPSPSVTHNANNASTYSATSAAGGDRAKPSGATKRSRQEGNVRRLRNMNDDDDENATWNGNSTQQM